MFTIVTARGSQSVEFEFDRVEDDFEVLHFQIISLFDDLDEDFILIDFAGRELRSLKDLDDLHVTTTAMLKRGSDGNGDGDDDGIRLYVWVVDVFHELFNSTCSAVTFPCDQQEEEGGEGIIQPRFRIIDTPFDLCL